MRIWDFFKSFPSDPEYTKAWREFDLKEYQADLLLSLPLEVLGDKRATRLYVRKELDKKVRELMESVLNNKTCGKKNL